MFVFLAASLSFLALAVHWRPRNPEGQDLEMGAVSVLATPGRPPGLNPPVLRLGEGPEVDADICERLRRLRLSDEEGGRPAVPDFLVM